ncbi:MAG: DMT family transporter [Alphaproteobacteria bacterium]|nr:DMT family transporter [Alphaproteobacteria bacterium]
MGQESRIGAGLAALVNGLLIGLATVASRHALAEASPAALAFLRYAAGVLCLAPIVFLLPRVRFAARDLLPMGLLGIAQFGVLILLLNWGLQHMPAARATLIFATFPLLTLAIAASFGLERLTAAKLGGVALTLAGVTLAMGDKLTDGIPDGPLGWWPELSVFASALTGAICSVLYRPYVRHYPALQVGAFAMVAAVAALAASAGAEGFFAEVPSFRVSVWFAILVAGLSSGLGYFLWLWALARASPTRVTVFVGTGPLAAALLGWWFLGEPLSPLFGAAILCLGAGLWLAHREAPARPPSETRPAPE